ncbi:hypothetical protein EDB86DRAFT_2823968 [Lactarius hatsudake]|nr:hypothetical protein EDB86DRAFT_2823968 [Lactarius hatsudake]
MNHFTAFSDHLLGPGGSRRHTFEIASSCLLLVEAKHWSDDSDKWVLSTHIPEAVSQAIALLKIAKDIVENTDLPLCETMQLLYEWLNPTVTDKKIAKLVNGLTVDTEVHIADLYSRIKKTYTYINMDITLTQFHPTSGHELWLDSSVNYAVVEYNLEVDNKKCLLDSGAREDVFRITNGHLFLVEAKC